MKNINRKNIIVYISILLIYISLFFLCYYTLSPIPKITNVYIEGSSGLSTIIDLTDYGERTVFNKKVIDSGVVKVGDLLSSAGPSGGHIELIVGEDNNYYYVTERLLLIQKKQYLKDTIMLCLWIVIIKKMEI